MLGVVGGGTSGMTAALLLAKQGHKVTIFEKSEQLGGLWSCRFDPDGFYDSENSCKVYQSSYRTSPALFELIDTTWPEHFVARHDLKKEWLRPFLTDCSLGDLWKLSTSFFAFLTGVKTYKTESVEDFLNRKGFTDPCRDWLRATALGGVTGTLRMTVWELFHRTRFNLSSMFFARSDVLYWNAQPPNSPSGFITKWRRKLEELGVEIKVGCAVTALSTSDEGDGQVVLSTSDGKQHTVDAAFLGLPPPQFSRLLDNSAPRFSTGWGHEVEELPAVLEDSIYEHVGIAWTFDEDFERDLPLGGHDVRSGWYPILVQFPQYAEYLRAPAKTVVIGSISLNTDFKHPRLGTLARDHDSHELAEILWADQRLSDPSLPAPRSVSIFGGSSATQIVRHGPLSTKNADLPIFLTTHINGQSPYFTSSLESTIQAGNAAAAAFDREVMKLPV